MTTTTDLAIGSRSGVRASDTPTVILSVARVGDVTVLTVGDITIYPVVERGVVRNERQIRLSDQDVRLLIQAVTA